METAARGAPASVAATLRAAFPHVEKLTKTQARFVPAIFSSTGTGKCVESTYRLRPNTILTNRPNHSDSMLALLSAPRLLNATYSVLVVNGELEIRDIEGVIAAP